MTVEQIAIAPRVVWSDQPEICVVTLGRAPKYLTRASRYEGLPMYRRGNRRYWIVDEVVAFFKATGRKENNFK